jgi:putative glutamine amidotransferase
MMNGSKKMPTGNLLVSTRVVEETAYVEKRSAIAYEYVEFFESLGYALILIPANTERAEEYLALPHDGVILTGGNTVPPSRNRESKAEIETPAGIYPERDRVERLLIEGAIEGETPVIGICRGMQFINSFFGGITSYGIEGHVSTKHVLTSQNRLLDGQLVNSYHGDGIIPEGMSPILRVIASTPEPFIEAIYHPDHSILGLQWHPERQNYPFDRLIIQHFLTTGKLP